MRVMPPRTRRGVPRVSLPSACLALLMLGTIMLGSGLLTTGLLGPSTSHADSKQDPAAAKLRAMGRGINILGYDGIWSGHIDAPFQLRWLKKIHDAGFSHVRINLHAFEHIDDVGALEPELLPRLDRVLRAAEDADLIAVIDEHDFEACQRDAALCERKLVSFWTAAGQYFAGRHPSAVFELLNEPAGELTQEQWNTLSGRLLRILRASNPKRTIIVAALNVDDIAQINGLRLPEDDRNLIATVHYYKPMRFTHQGASWETEFGHLKNVRWGSKQDRDLVTTEFDAIDTWAKSTGRPVYLGEFGVYDRAPMGDRAGYIAFMTKSAEARGWSWAYWQFDHDFAAFRPETQTWVAEILQALQPREAHP